MLVGLAAGTLDMALAYAKQRQQVGRPIGSFQAMKHLCADMLVASEMARAASTPPPSPSNSPAAADTVSATRGTSSSSPRQPWGTARLLQ